MEIFGFGLIRNGIKYDYPFIESIRSLQDFCEDIFYAVGTSEDGTEEKMEEEFPGIKKKATVWDESMRTKGLILSQQTNVVLEFLRERHGKNDNAWGFYLQSDEVVHEDDYDQIMKDVQIANKQGCDAVCFRYFHFWLRYDRIAINKKWYPQEIRCIRLKTPIESWGDAQSFRNHKKPYYSDARIFHYGHVREEKAYDRKKKDILEYYVNGNQRRKRRILRRHERHNVWIPYLGTHPKVMKQRMKEAWNKQKVDKVFVVGQRKDYSEEFLEKILAKEILFIRSFREREKGCPLVITEKETIFDKIFRRSKVPQAMLSPLARPWSKETILMLKLSEAGVSSL